MDRPLVFIVGQHRSGTTILYHALAACGPFAWPGPFHLAYFEDYLRNLGFDRAAALEAISARFAAESIVTRFVDEIPAGPLTPEEYGFALPGGRFTPRTRGTFELFCAFAAEGAPPDRRLLLKNPRDIGGLGFISDAFPDARFIFLNRCPGPVIASRLRELQMLFRRHSPYQAVIEPAYAAMSRRRRAAIALALRLEAPVAAYLVMEFARDARRMARAQKRLGDERAIAIRYEDLCADPKRVLAEVLGFLGLPTDDVAAGAQVIAPRIGRPVNNSVLGSVWAERRLRFYLDAWHYPSVN